MWKVYFGEFTSGRLQRLQYLGYVLLLMAIMFGFMLAIIFAIGASEHIIGGDLQQAQDKLRGWFSLPATLIVSLVFLLVLVAKLNIIAKRIRDMGLSGWWIALVLFIVVGGTSAAYSEQVGGGLFSILSLLLLLIPSDTFGRK